MGIYESGIIYGIRMYSNNDCILFEYVDNEIMSEAENKKAYVFYTQLKNKNEIRIEYYTECSSTYGEKDNFLMWCPMSLDFFVKKCGV